MLPKLSDAVSSVTTESASGPVNGADSRVDFDLHMYPRNTIIF